MTPDAAIELARAALVLMLTICGPMLIAALIVGVLIGLPIAWILSRLMTPYVTGMNQIPLWVPPLPIALIALALFYFGFRTWLRADNLPPPPASHDDHGHH
jgi:flagellar biosynthesis protein FliQ